MCPASASSPSLCFVLRSLELLAHPRYERPAGLLITLYVYIVYVIALRFEGPFTDMIYSNRAARDSAQAKSESKKEL